MNKILKRSIKISLHLFSMVTLMVLVFFGGILGKISSNHGDASKKDGENDADRLYSAFPVNYAHADAPVTPDPVVVTDPPPITVFDGDPCDGAGSSCDGPGPGPGPC